MSAGAMTGSAATRPVALRMRSDLQSVAQSYGGERFWAIKDPLALRYFHLNEEEHFVWTLLDGRSSLSAVQSRFEERFAPRRLSFAQLQTFLGTLYREGLIQVDAPGQGDELRRRALDSRRQRRWQALANVLAIRFRGFDPDRFLNWLAPRTRFLFSHTVLVVLMLFTASAAALALVNFETIQSRLPEFESFFTVSNVFWLAAVLAATKVLHELGHALTCKLMGRECHEMGVLLLVFTPCLYCNVSDAWMIPDKWRRAAVGAAGIAVELFLAALATYLWWWTSPGLINSLCLNIMLVCSISTVLFNGNPLLRYDGYYVLSDLIEIPNLADAAAEELRDVTARLVLGMDPVQNSNSSSRRQLGLALFGLASATYRWCVVFGILWFVQGVLKPHGLEPLVQLAAVVVLGGMLVPAVVRGCRFLRNAVSGGQLRGPRATGGLLALVVAISAGALVPLPHRIAAAVVLQPANARRIYATVSGRLVEAVGVGQVVKQDDQVALLANFDLKLEIENLRGQRNQQRLHVENLKRRQVQDDRAASQLLTAEEGLADLEVRLERRLADAARLRLTAPIAGTILPPRPKVVVANPNELKAWSGLPLDPVNLGSQIESGTLMCLVGNPASHEALLVIDQSDIEFVAPGMLVEIGLNQSPGNGLTGVIDEIAELDVQIAPPELLRAGDIPTRTDEMGTIRPLNPSYQARVALHPHSRTVLLGETGRARIQAAPLSLGRRLVRMFSRTFRFAL